MTKDNAKDYLPLVEALARGERIQILHKGIWMDLPNPDFCCDVNEYRIKPEPLECWVTFYDESFNKGFGGAYLSEDQAKRGACEHLKRIIHMREVED